MKKGTRYEVLKRLEKYESDKGTQDDGYVYDEAHTYFEDLSRGEWLHLLEWLVQNYK